MASRKAHPHNPKKPGFWLGFFIWFSVSVALAVVVSEFPWHDPVDGGVDNRPFQFDSNKWLAFAAAATALIAALISARISLQNTIKQHTINTLLQMRLSDAYMSRAERVTQRYFGQKGNYYLTDAECDNPPPEAVISDVIYILNYLEYIASAIRGGDLDEDLVRESLRGMLCNNYECAELWIKKRRDIGGGRTNPKLYEHLEWLYRRWFIAKHKRTLLTRV